jgi:hypothetical protein
MPENITHILKESLEKMGEFDYEAHKPEEDNDVVTLGPYKYITSDQYYEG